MLMSLGMFAFDLATLPFQELDEKAAWRHGSTPRFGARPASQFLGPGEDSITLSGTLLPGVAGSLGSMAALMQMADQGEAWPLVDGEGDIHGVFIIESIGQKKGHFIVGGTPRKIDFTIELKRVA